MLLLGYPKSGNTWIAYMLSYVFNTIYDDYDAPGLHPKRESIRKYVKGGLPHKSFERELGHVLKTHRQNIKSRGERVVYVIRDPRDVMVSYFFYKKNLMSQNADVDLHQFIKENLPEWTDHVNTWIDHAHAVIKYEDATENLHRCLNQLCDDLGVTIDYDVIEKVKDQFSFKSMSGRDRGDSDNSSFYRKGVVGDWKTYFGESDTEYFSECAGGLMRQLGYDTTAEIS